MVARMVRLPSLQSAVTVQSVQSAALTTPAVRPATPTRTSSVYG